MQSKLILLTIAFLACDSDDGFSPTASASGGLRVSGGWTETRGVRENSCSTRLPKIASQHISILQADGLLTVRTPAGHERSGTIDTETGDFELDTFLEIAGETWTGEQRGRFFSADSYGARTFVNLVDTATEAADSCRVVTSDVGQKGTRSIAEGVESEEPETPAARP
ncbi:MAG: hypothetical protein KAI97_07465 [Gemmatimonadetes bacterium]|nr:hypothetical protein [Gemmatimonadota bacterium]